MGENKKDAFWMLDAVADNYDFAGLWEERMIKVRECMEILTSLMIAYTPRAKETIVRTPYLPLSPSPFLYLPILPLPPFIIFISQNTIG